MHATHHIENPYVSKTSPAETVSGAASVTRFRRNISWAKARTDFGLAHAPVPVEHAGARSAGVAKMPATDPTTKDQLTRALGDAVIRIWSNLPQDVQNHLFQEAVSSQGESIRSQLAIFLHDKHSRTSDPLGNPREMPEPDSHGG
jgi:hypothetical protein